VNSKARRFVPVVLVTLLALAARPVFAGAHTWDVNEAFTTADGKIWFIELREANGTPGETGVGNQIVSSTLAQFAICINPPTTCNVVSPTSNKQLLFGNPAYVELAAAQGAPPPNQVVNTVGFYNVAGETLRYGPYDTWITPAIPTDGVNSQNRLIGVVANSPTNYAGATGSIDASSPSPSVVPDGEGATNPILVEKLDPDGTSLRVTWDTQTCLLDGDHQLIYGELSDLPLAPGGTYTPAGSVCGLGDSGVLDWAATPNATDGSGLIWWVITVNNGADVEGSWGRYDGVNERQGPGTGGSSGECAVTGKDLRNTCGG